MLAALAAFFALAVPAGSRGQPEPLVFVVSPNEPELHAPVDYLTWCGDCAGVDYTTGTPWVVNPEDGWPFFIDYQDIRVPCMWDSDDAYQYQGFDGTLATGTTISVQACAYWSNNAFQPRVTAVLIDSPSDQLQITVTWVWDTGSRTTQVVPPTRGDFGMWRYFDCISSPVPEGPMVTVPGSNGGQAVPFTITTTIANPGKKTGKTGGYIAGGFPAGGKPAWDLGCRTYRTP